MVLKNLENHEGFLERVERKFMQILKKWNLQRKFKTEKISVKLWNILESIWEKY